MKAFKNVSIVFAVSLAVAVLEGLLVPCDAHPGEYYYKPGFTDLASAQINLKGPLKKDRIEVGQWVSYQVKRYRMSRPDNAPVKLPEANIKVGVVGREIIMDNEYLWVELNVNEGRENQRILKFMIDTKGNPQAEKLILKYGSLPAVEINLRIWDIKTRITREMLFDEMISELNVIPFARMLIPESFDQSLISYETLPVKFPSRQEISLNCVKVSLKHSDSTMPDGYAWYSDKTPLAGLVQFMLTEAGFRTTILMQDYNHSGAQSLIRESPIKLDFREWENELGVDPNKCQ